MKYLTLITMACLLPAAGAGQTNDEKRRAAYRAKMEKLWAIEERIDQTRPRRRDTPLRADNIHDYEVRQIHTTASSLLPSAIINISSVVTGCPCEEGLSCSDQVWILAYQSETTSGLQLSKIGDRWTIGAVQRWWLEYEKLEARRDDFKSTSAYFDAQDALKEQFPACTSSPEGYGDTKGAAAEVK